MADKKYVKKLEDVIKQMLRPMHDIPLSLVIESISGHKILPFNRKDEKDIVVLKKLAEVANDAGRNINSVGIIRARANEVGNDIESFVKNSLNDLGYKAYTPNTRSGTKKTMGYPDIEFIDKFSRTNYLECKTFNIDNISTSQRSFYLSPSENFKVTQDAHHFVISFEIFVQATSEQSNLYNCKSWKILSIEDLTVNVKYEFNADNTRLYSKEMILAEGKIN